MGKDNNVGGLPVTEEQIAAFIQGMEDEYFGHPKRTEAEAAYDFEVITLMLANENMDLPEALEAAGNVYPAEKLAPANEEQMNDLREYYSSLLNHEYIKRKISK